MKIHQILINDTNKIPNELPKFHDLCTKQIKKIYPNCEYHLYSGEELEKIIENNFHIDVFTAYKKLKPYACKADLARLCLLYLYGGLYIDLNTYIVDTIPNLNKLDFFAFRDLPQSSFQSWSVQNGIIYSRKGFNILKNTIDLIISNCIKEYYGFSPNNISSTLILGMGIMKSLTDDNNNIATNGQLCYISLDLLDDNLKNHLHKIGYSNLCMGFMMDNQNRIIAIRKLASKGDIKSVGFDGTNNYNEMWENEDVYDTSIKFTKISKLIYQ